MEDWMHFRVSGSYSSPFLGLGNRKRKAEPFTDEKINLLYSKNLLAT
jgi:hypothetical protein